jgi:hypothetical protein
MEGAGRCCLRSQISEWVCSNLQQRDNAGASCISAGGKSHLASRNLSACLMICGRARLSGGSSAQCSDRRSTDGASSRIRKAGAQSQPRLDEEASNDA